MKIIRVSALLASLSLGGFAAADKKGYCPPPLPPSALAALSRAPAANSTDNTNLVTVSVLTVVSDTGYVCSAEVLHGVQKEANVEAVNVVRKQHFTPAKKDGRPVPFVIGVAVNFLRGKDGKLVLVPSSVPQLLKEDVSKNP